MLITKRPLEYSFYANKTSAGIPNSLWNLLAKSNVNGFLLFNNDEMCPFDPYFLVTRSLFLIPDSSIFNLITSMGSGNGIFLNTEHELSVIGVKLKIIDKLRQV